MFILVAFYLVVPNPVNICKPRTPPPISYHNGVYFCFVFLASTPYRTIVLVIVYLCHAFPQLTQVPLHFFCICCFSCYCDSQIFQLPFNIYVGAKWCFRDDFYWLNHKHSLCRVMWGRFLDGVVLFAMG